MRIDSMTALKCYWQIPRPSLIMSSNDVHLWRAKLDQSDECIKQLTQMLEMDFLIFLDDDHSFYQ